MIKKLRKKFIFINMILISFVLLTTFGILLFFHQKNLESEVTTRMTQLLERPMNSEEKRPVADFEKYRPEPSDFIPVYDVFTDPQGNIREQETGYFSLSSDILSLAVEKVLSVSEEKGILRDLNLRYLKRTIPNGIHIVFADQNYEISSLRSMMISCIIVLFLALIAFFFITLFLSKWVLHPVEQAWSQQNQFVADASHELKTPLTVILANLNILRAHPDDTIRSQMKWLENTYAESTRMKKLVDHLLFLAKSDAKQISVPFSSLNLSDIVWSCLLPFESIAFEQKITITEEISPDLWIRGNEQQIRQLIIILLDNACKYTDQNGTVRFLLNAEQNKISLKVSNTGEPIPPEDLEHIFERFYRSDKSRSRKQGGYGLGLAIAHSIVLKHSGKIHASSTSEATTFFVSFPMIKK